MSRCIPVAGYVCVTATQPAIIVPQVDTVINRGYTVDATSGTRSITDGTTDRLGTVSTNYNVTTTGCKKTSCQTFSAALLNTQNVVFRGNVIFANGSSVVGLGNSIIPTDAGTISDGESIIGNFGGTTLSLKSINGGSESFTASVNGDVISLSIASLASTGILSVSGTATVSGATTTSSACSISGGLTVNGDLVLSNGRIRGLDVGTVFSSITPATGKLLVGDGVGGVTSIVPNGTDVTNRARLTISTGSASGLAFANSGIATLKDMMPTYMGSVGYTIQSGDLLVSTGSAGNKWNAFHPSTNGFVYYSDTGPAIIPPGRVFYGLSPEANILNASIFTSFTSKFGNDSSNITVPYAFVEQSLKNFSGTLVGGLFLDYATNNARIFTLPDGRDTIVSPTFSNGIESSNMRIESLTYFLRNLVFCFRHVSFNPADTTYTSGIVNPIPPTTDQYFAHKCYRYDGNYADIGLQFKTDGSVVLYRLGTYWPSLTINTEVQFCVSVCYEL